MREDAFVEVMSAFAIIGSLLAILFGIFCDSGCQNYLFSL